MRTNGHVSFASLRTPSLMHHRWITLSEAERMVQRKECYRKRMPRQRNPVYVLIPQPEPLRSFHEASPPSITAAEMQINAGLMGSREHRRQVRAKVKMFEQSRMVAVHA